MARERLRQPLLTQQGELLIKKPHTRFMGMLKGIPASEIPRDYSWRNINVIDYEGWYLVRSGTRQFTTTDLPSGTFLGVLDHLQKKVLVWHFDNEIWISDKEMTTFTQAVNQSATSPTGLGSLLAFGEDAIIVAGNVFRLEIESVTSAILYQVNVAIPSTLVTDINELAPDRVYGYRYLYSFARLSGSGNRNRVSGGDVEVKFESGTSLVDGQVKDYGERFYTTPISNDGSDPHSVSTLTSPAGICGLTHFPVYRTLNIGRNSGGIDPQTGIGNNEEIFGWTEDIPVTKSWKGVTDGAGTTITVDAGSNQPEIHDIGSPIENTLGQQSTITAISGGTFTISPAMALSSTIYFSMRQPSFTTRVMQISQVGNLVTITAGASVSASDVGIFLFYDDGSFATITTFVSASSFNVNVNKTITDRSGTIKPSGGGWERTFNDAVPDDGTNLGVSGLKQRLGAAKPVFVPRRFFRPLPTVDTAIIDSGFLVAVERDQPRYYYSQYGDKTQHIGYYLPVVQEGRLTDRIRHIVRFPSIAVFVLVRQMVPLPLNVSNDLGLNEVGENVFKLNEPILSDENIGVYHWQGIAYKGSNLIWALTSEPRIRTYDGHSWSKESYDIDVRTGLDAVNKTEISKIDPTFGVIAEYDEKTGYILWAWKRERVASFLIQDTGGEDFSPEEDIWQDTGGQDFAPDEDIIFDTAGKVT